MDRVREALKGQRRRSPSYEPLTAESNRHDDNQSDRSYELPGDFSRLNYGIFILLGAAMLWAWYSQDFHEVAMLANTWAQERLPRCFPVFPATFLVLTLPVNAFPGLHHIYLDHHDRSFHDSFGPPPTLSVVPSTYHSLPLPDLR